MKSWPSSERFSGAALRQRRNHWARQAALGFLLTSVVMRTRRQIVFLRKPFKRRERAMSRPVTRDTTRRHS